MNNDLISREALLKAMEEERQYLLARGQTGAEHIIVHHCLPIIDNAPTVEPRIEFGTDGQPYRLFMSGGQVVPDTLHGWRYEERPQGECEKCDYRKFTEKFIDDVVDWMDRYGITSVEQLSEILKGGAE